MSSLKMKMAACLTAVPLAMSGLAVMAAPASAVESAVSAPTGEVPEDACPSDFKTDQMWEITWGYGFEDRNGGAAKFNMQSNGGLKWLNDKPVPAYMGNPATSTWRWLYVNKPSKTNYTVKYGFADGTVRHAYVVAGSNGCPTVTWDEVAPVADSLTTGHNQPLKCGEVTVWARHVGRWIYPVSVSKDGSDPTATGPFYGPVVDNRTDTNGDNKPDLNGPQKDVTKFTTYKFAEDSGPQVLKYVVAAGTEKDLYVGTPAAEITTVEVETNCLPDVVEAPVVPVWEDPCGADNGHFAYLGGEFYSYEESTNEDGSITVTAVADEGYVFPEGSVTEWTNKDSNEACPVAPTPTPIPETPVAPTPTPTPIPETPVVVAPTPAPITAQDQSVKPGAKKHDKCGTRQDKVKGLNVAGVEVYKFTLSKRVNGKVVKSTKHAMPGVSVKTKGAFKVKVKAVLQPGFTANGKTSWTFKFSDKPCKQQTPAPPINQTPSAGLRVVGLGK